VQFSVSCWRYWTSFVEPVSTGNSFSLVLEVPIVLASFTDAIPQTSSGSQPIERAPDLGRRRVGYGSFLERTEFSEPVPSGVRALMTGLFQRKYEFGKRVSLGILSPLSD
jgi:hypothetical protein